MWTKKKNEGIKYKRKTDTVWRQKEKLLRVQREKKERKILKIKMDEAKNKKLSKEKDRKC